MHEIPSPTHGLLGVTLAFFGYVLLVVGVAVGLSRLGLPEPLVLAGSVGLAVGLFAAFLPLFRRLTPERAGGS